MEAEPERPSICQANRAAQMAAGNNKDAISVRRLSGMIQYSAAKALCSVFSAPAWVITRQSSMPDRKAAMEAYSTPSQAENSTAGLGAIRLAIGESHRLSRTNVRDYSSYTCHGRSTATPGAVSSEEHAE